MQKWEYLIVFEQLENGETMYLLRTPDPAKSRTIPMNKYPLISLLNWLGSEGWELTSRTATENRITGNLTHHASTHVTLEQWVFKRAVLPADEA